MKKKMIIGLILVTVLAIGATVFATNANFTAVSNSIQNTFKMGTVAMQSDNGQVGQTIDMGTIFDESNAGTLEAGVVKTKNIAIRGSLPVTLSLGGLLADGSIAPTNVAAPEGVISTWWRHYKMKLEVIVTRNNSVIKDVQSRPDSVSEGFDSIFDTIVGTTHTPATDNTTGLNTLLSQLGTLLPGDLVTIKTTTKFVQTAYYTTAAREHGGPDARVDGNYTLTQDEVNAFQGKGLYINLSLVATEAAK